MVNMNFFLSVAKQDQIMWGFLFQDKADQCIIKNSSEEIISKRLQDTHSIDHYIILRLMHY